MSDTRILIYVQHLLGIGHVRRMVLVANALHAAGASVTFVTGGAPIPHMRPAPGIRVVQLPAISAADIEFSGLVDEQGEPVDDWLKQQRGDLLVNTVTDCQPDIALVEMFPFGRRQMRFELVPMLDALQAMSPRPEIVSSVRDIINLRPHRVEETLNWLNRYFDQVVVHSDPTLFRLEDSFPEIDQFKGGIAYSGYITPEHMEDAAPAGIDNGQILVSAGGGAVGEQLFELAARVAPQFPNHLWRFRHGRKTSPATLAHWRRLAPDAIFEPVAADFLQHLNTAALSISQAGYNTVCDLFATQCRSVLIPFAGGSETEQTRRCERLKGRGFLMSEANASPAQLAETVEHALQAPPPDVAELQLGGASETARILLKKFHE